MVELYVVKHQFVSFGKNERTVGGDFIVRDADSIPVNIISADGKADAKIMDSFKRLTGKEKEDLPLQQMQGPSKPKRTKLSGCGSQAPAKSALHAELCLNTRSYGGSKREWIRIGGEIMDKFQANLEGQGLAVKVKVEISRLKLLRHGVTELVEVDQIVTNEVTIKELSKLGHIENDGTITRGAQLYSSQDWMRQLWKEASLASGHLTIKAFIINFGLNPAPRNPLCRDVIIKASGGEVTCHRYLLSGYCPELDAEIESQQTETAIINMTDMSLFGVRALVNYLYFDYLEVSVETPFIAVEVLQAAVKYKVDDLKEKICDMLKNLDDEYFGAEAAIKLFLAARQLPRRTGEPIKKRAWKLMQRNRVTLAELPSYGALLNDPIAVGDLVEVALIP